VCGSVSEERGGGGLGVWGGVGQGALQIVSEEVAGLEWRGEEGGVEMKNKTGGNMGRERRGGRQVG
jgi:hypothetical protein